MKFSLFSLLGFGRRSSTGSVGANMFTVFFNRFVAVKADPERAKNYTKFGWQAIIIGLICVAISYPCMWLGKALIFDVAFTYLGAFTVMLLIGNIVTFILGIMMFFIPPLMCFYSICLPIFQMIVNRKAIGWISLIVVIICLIATIVLCLMGLSTLSMG